MKATVWMKSTRGGEQVKHEVPGGSSVENQNGLIVITNALGTEHYFAAPIDDVDHVTFSAARAVAESD